MEIHETASTIAILSKVKSGNREPWVLLDLAIAYLFARDYENADAAAHKLLHLPAPTPVPAWALIGIANARMDRPEPALAAFHKAASLESANEENWLNLTRELMEVSRYPEAITAVQEGLAANPRSYALHLRLGAAYLSTNRYAESEAVFRELIAAGDPLPTSYVGLAQVLLRTGRSEEATSELTAAQQTLGSSFLISYFRGLALQRTAKPAEALAAFQEAALQNSTSAEVQLGIGEVELKLGRPRAAIAAFEKVLLGDPENKPARRLLSAAYRRAGDNANATKYAQAQTAEPEKPAKDLIGDFFLPGWQVPPDANSQPH